MHIFVFDWQEQCIYGILTLCQAIIWFMFYCFIVLLHLLLILFSGGSNIKYCELFSYLHAFLIMNIANIISVATLRWIWIKLVVFEYYQYKFTRCSSCELICIKNEMKTQYRCSIGAEQRIAITPLLTQPETWVK